MEKHIKQQPKGYGIVWAAVLERTILDIKKTKDKRGCEALFWLRDEKSTVFNSFTGICKTLDLDPDITRKSILKYIYN